MNHYIGKVVLDEGGTAISISHAVEQLNNDYTDAAVIAVVPGGILYTADLTRKLKFDISMGYISYPHTPGERNSNSTTVYHQNIETESYHVVLIDDVMESGGIMKRLVKYILDSFNPTSLPATVLFAKPGRANIPVKQYFAYEIESGDLLIDYSTSWDNKYHSRSDITRLIKQPVMHLC